LNPNSPDRCLFLTGVSGCGKTSLLHQYALIGEYLEMDVIEANGVDALTKLTIYAHTSTTPNAPEATHAPKRDPLLSSHLSQTLSKQ